MQFKDIFQHNPPSRLPKKVQYWSCHFALVTTLGGLWGNTQALANQQDTTALIETMVVTGTRLANTAESTPRHTTVITREAIERRRDASVIDLLRSIAGIQVTQYGGRGGVSSIFVRGAEPNFTVVLLNGVKVNDPNNTRGGSFDFSTLNLAEVERVELVRGPQSAIYGSDSLAGVISITTRRGTSDFRASVDAEVGQQGFYRTSLRGSGAISNNTIASGTISRTDDGDAVSGNRFHNTAASIHLASEFSEELKLDVSARHASSDANSFPEDSGGSRLAVLRILDTQEQQQTSFAAQLGWQATPWLSGHLLASYAQHKDDKRSPGIASGIRDGIPATQGDSDLERLNLSSYARLDLSKTLSLTSGFDYQREDGELTGSVELAPGFSLPTDFNLDRNIKGVFAEASYQNNSGITLSAAIRNDNPSNDSSETTLLVGAQYQLEATRLFANWGEGFKLPSFFALGHALVGNPNLAPETSQNWELGVSQQWQEGSLQTTLVLFQNTFDNLIDFDFDLFTNVNRNEVRTQGVELASNWQVSNSMEVQAHLTYLDIDVKDNVTKLRQRPNLRGGISVNTSLNEQWSLHANWLYKANAEDSSVPTGPQELDAYNLLNARLTWSPKKRIQVWLAIDNLLDDDYEETIGFENPGFRSRIGLRYQL